MKGNTAEVKKIILLSLLFWGIIEYIIHCRITRYGALIKINGNKSMVFALLKLQAMDFFVACLGGE